MAPEGSNELVSTYSIWPLKGGIRECPLTADGPEGRNEEVSTYSIWPLRGGMRECPLTADDC